MDVEEHSRPRGEMMAWQRPAVPVPDRVVAKTNSDMCLNETHRASPNAEADLA